MIDVVWRTRPGDFNDELAFSIRSVEANLPHRSISVAGYRPFWLNCHRVSKPARDGTPHEDALANLRAIADCDTLTPAVAVFDDDQYVMAPLHRLPVLHRGPLKAATAERPAGSPRHRAMQDTASILQRLGIPDPYCYDLHTPAVFNRAELTETLNLIHAYTRGWDTDRAARILWKTIHFNYWTNHRATYSPDIKIRHMTTETPWPSPFLSSIDLAFTYGAVGQHVRQAFPTPSRYEATP